MFNLKFLFMKQLWFFSGILSLLLVSTILSCDPKDDTPPPPTPPEKSSSMSYNFEEWIYDNVGWFDNGEGKLEPFVRKDEEKYYDTKNLTYVTLNNLYSLDGGGLPPGPLTAFRDTDHKEGQYSIKLVSDDFPLGDSAVFIPGVVGTVKVNLSAFTTDISKLALFGTPYTGNDNHLTFWYKYQPVNNDSAMVYVETSKWDNAEKKRISLKKTEKQFNTAVSEWTKCELSLDQFEQGVPDSIIILFVSSAGFDFNNLFGCKGQEGSALWIDDIQFSE